MNCAIPNFYQNLKPYEIGMNTCRVGFIFVLYYSNKPYLANQHFILSPENLRLIFTIYLHACIDCIVNNTYTYLYFIIFNVYTMYLLDTYVIIVYLNALIFASA